MEESETSSDVNSRRRGNGRVATCLMENLDVPLPYDMTPI
jgi:hypothetical protein